MPGDEVDIICMVDLVMVIMSDTGHRPLMHTGRDGKSCGHGAVDPFQMLVAIQFSFGVDVCGNYSQKLVPCLNFRIFCIIR